MLVIPYLALLALYIVMMGLGGAVLHYQVRAVETRLLIDEMLAATEPLAERLRSGDAIAAMRDNAAWLVADVESANTMRSAKSSTAYCTKPLFGR